MSQNSKPNVGFIGAGMMASAMMKGFIANKIGNKIYASDISPGSKEKVESFGAVFASSNSEVVSSCDVIFLAVKPGIVPIVLKEVGGMVDSSKLVVSIAAGVTIESIESKLPSGSKVIRVMPNTPCLVGEMAAGFSAGKLLSYNFHYDKLIKLQFFSGSNATAEDMKYVETVLNTMGTALSCAEKDLNAITGLSGSGPAYIFLLIEALADGGVLAGLPRQTAQKLAAQTVKVSDVFM